MTRSTGLLDLADPPSPTDPPNAGILARHGIDLRRDLVAHLGPKLAFYAQAPRSEDTATAATMLMSHLAGFTMAAQVRETAAASKGVDSLIKSFNPILREQLRGDAAHPIYTVPGVLEVSASARPSPGLRDGLAC